MMFLAAFMICFHDSPLLSLPAALFALHCSAASGNRLPIFVLLFALALFQIQHSAGMFPTCL